MFQFIDEVRQAQNSFFLNFSQCSTEGSIACEQNRATTILDICESITIIISLIIIVDDMCQSCYQSILAYIYIKLSIINMHRLDQLPEYHRVIPKLIQKYKIKAMLKVWKKRSKNSKQRWYKLRQLGQTEQSYLEKLLVLRDQVKKPLRDSNLISEIQQTLIFANLDGMIQLATQMKSKIDKLLQTWNPITTIIAPTIESLVIYLKIYKEFSNNYSKSDKMIHELMQQQQYSEVVKIPNVLDYLFKPVQRPLQYKLFLADYLKLLPPQHKDRQNLQKALNTLLKIADQINEFVQKQVRASKMIELQNIYGNLIESTRQYKSQLFAMHPDFNCKVYVFNDLLLIVKCISQFKDQKFMHMPLCGGSYVVRQPDNKQFKNRLYICGTYQSIHLTFKCQQDANIAFTLIDNLITNLYQKQFARSELLTQYKNRRQTMVMNRHSMASDIYKWKQQADYRIRLKIQVIGVEKRLYQKQWRIVYSVKIQLNRPESIYQIAYYQLDQLKDIQKYIRQVYPSLIVPSLDTKLKGMSYDDPKTDFTKYYEYKCILIQDFMNFCFRSKQLSKRPQFIVYKLRIHECIWDYLNRFSTDCNCDACMSLEVLTNMEGYKMHQQKIRDKKFQFCILNAFFYQNMLAEQIKPAEFKKFTLNQKLTWAVCKERRIEYGLQNRGQFGKKVVFHVSIQLIGEQSQVYIENATVNDTCRQIVQQVCIRKGITDTLDFCLVYVHGGHQYYLDDDEFVFDAIKHLDEEFRKFESDKRLSNTSTRVSVFSAFSKNMDDFGDTLADFSVADQPKLYMRKYLSLGLAMQQMTCKRNPERYPLVLAEILRKFQKQLLLLSVQEIKTFCALFYGIQQFNTIIFSKNIFCNEQKLKKFLPQSKWSFVSPQFIQKVRQILQTQVKPCINILLLYKAVLSQFGDKVGAYTQYFPVQNLDPATMGLKQKNFMLGVNYNKVVVGRRFNSVSLLEFPLKQFQYRISGDCLFIDTEQKSYRFIGNGFTMFQQMYLKYKTIIEIEHDEKSMI